MSTDFWFSVLSAVSSTFVFFSAFPPPAFESHSRQNIYLPCRFSEGLVDDPRNGRVVLIAIRYLSVASVFYIPLSMRGSALMVLELMLK